MFKRIMVPVDLRCPGELSNTLEIACEIAKTTNAALLFVGVTASAPTEIAHNPEEFSQKLSALGQEFGEKHGLTVESHAFTSHDPAVDVDKKLLEAIDMFEVDLVVMATHVPGIREYLFGSVGNRVASHAKVSVFLVRV